MGNRTHSPSRREFDLLADTVTVLGGAVDSLGAGLTTLGAVARQLCREQVAGYGRRNRELLAELAAVEQVNAGLRELLQQCTRELAQYRVEREALLELVPYALADIEEARAYLAERAAEQAVEAGGSR